MRDNILRIIGFMVVLTCFAMTVYRSNFYVGACENPKSVYFENVTALVIGRSRTIATGISWLKRLFIGFQTYFGVLLSDTPHEMIRVTIFNPSHMKILLSFLGMVRTNVFMQGVTGIFFYGCGKSFCISKTPPMVLAYCHVDKIWIIPYATI